jgi:NAD(P)-dependent dehydrogenase (short-subunit alcohol dehydrogenase family)
MSPTRTLITGCSTGIGRAAAQLFADRGHDVIATMRDPRAGTALTTAGCSVVALDVTDAASIARVRAEVGPVDVLVNNAGVGYYGALETMPEELVRATFDANLFGALAMIRAVLPSMREREGGTIVNVSSVMGRLAVPVSGAYAMSKFALEAMSEVLALELSPFGIRIAIVEPGFIQTSIASTGRPKSRMRADSPYAALEQRMTDRNEAGVAGGERPELAAEAIWDAVHADTAQLRFPVGAGAGDLIESRRATPDEPWLAGLRRSYGITEFTAQTESRARTADRG